MPTPMEQLATANAEVARLTGIETQFNTLMGQIPGGSVASLTTLIAEHGQFKADAGRLTTELSTAATENTRLTSEITRLNGEIETVRASVQERAELSAAEIVATTGNQAPAAAETVTASVSNEPANFEAFKAEHARLHVEDRNKGMAYYAQWSKKFGF